MRRPLHLSQGILPYEQFLLSQHRLGGTSISGCEDYISQWSHSEGGVHRVA